MSLNPLLKNFRKVNTYVRLPTLGIWYQDGSVELNEDGEVGIYPLTGIDEAMLNTPDAMLNGVALEEVIKNCVPSVKNIKNLLIPDLEAIFVGIQSASNSGILKIDRECPSCKHENRFEIDCRALLDSASVIDSSDSVINFSKDFRIHIKPYTFELRQLFTKKQFEEEKALKVINDAGDKIDELEKAALFAASFKKIAELTFTLVSKSIEKIDILNDDGTINESISDTTLINEWMVAISKNESELIINSINKLNNVGIAKELTFKCESCDHTWSSEQGYDPTSFFVPRS